MFPTGQDSAFFLDKETGVPSLPRDKGTMGRAQNLAMGRDGLGQSVKIQDETWDGTITIFLPNSGMGRTQDGTITIFPINFCFRISFVVLECTFLVLERPFLF